jgi:DNA-binding transcriptional MerR regulator
MTGLEDSVIKRWEVQFPQLKPIRNRAANRSYSEKDLKLIFYIRDLIYVHKLEEEEVKVKIRSYNPNRDSESLIQLQGLLAEIKMEVEEIRNLLNT